MEYKKICEKIANEDYEKEASESVWGGAGIVLCDKPSDRWEWDQSIDYYCTENSSRFVWLLELMSDYLYEDSLAKYENLRAYLAAIRKAKKQSYCLKEQLFFVAKAMEAKKNGEAFDLPEENEPWDTAEKDLLSFLGKDVNLSVGKK